MKIRKRINSSGSTSIQIYNKVGNKSIHIKTIGCSSNPYEIEQLYQQGLDYIQLKSGQTHLDLQSNEDDQWFIQTGNSIKNVQLLGPEIILGLLYDQIGFNKIQEDLFRHLVISRIISPGSKLETTRYLQLYQGKHLDVQQIYRYMDKLYNEQQAMIEQISYAHTLSVLDANVSVVFYDVTTIYFEAEKEDELRVTGFSKDGKHKHPQIILGLLVSIGGYPLAYSIHKGSTYEGDTLIPIVESFKNRFSLSKLVVIADAGLLTKSNISTLQANNYDFIIGARIKSEKEKIKNQILNLTLTDGQSAVIEKGDSIKLIINYSEKRAKKDAKNRSRGLAKLEKLLNNNRLTKSHINNRGYNKYLKMTGKVHIDIDYEKFEKDGKWDGLKGYVTNTQLPIQSVLSSYKELWKIEKAFRISKTDLKIRPIYHRLERRIHAHICISFAAYKVYKELERQLKEKAPGISVNKAIELIKTIYGIELQHPITKQRRKTLFISSEAHTALLKSFNISQGWLE